MNVFFRRGSTPPIFKGPAVLRRCCPPSAEGLACCRSPHQPRGAAAVLPFFSARAEEAARCQCLRGWAQAVGHVTPSLDGGPPMFFSWGMWQEGQPLCRGGKGARHTPNLSSPSRRIADIHSFSLESLARTCWGRDYPDMTQKLILLGRFGKREELSPLGHHSASSRTDPDILSDICGRYTASGAYARASCVGWTKTLACDCSSQRQPHCSISWRTPCSAGPRRSASLSFAGYRLHFRTRSR